MVNYFALKNSIQKFLCYILLPEIEALYNLFYSWYDGCNSLCATVYIHSGLVCRESQVSPYYPHFPFKYPPNDVILAGDRHQDLIDEFIKN